jgi:SAM-dependent methyltransferase
MPMRGSRGVQEFAMKFRRLIRVLPLLMLFAAFPAACQQAPKQLDAPFVPSNQAAVDAMLRIANVGPDDYVIDLGSGDGRILITAARDRGARGFGVDLDPQRIRESLENARLAGVSDRVSFHQQNLFDTRIGKATVVTLYLLPRVNLQLRPRLLAELKPGTRVVSHDFDMGEWQPDLRATVRGSGSQVYFWVIPARVAGTWTGEISTPRGPQSLELEIGQTFQEIDAKARLGGKAVYLREARLDGDRISFVLFGEGDFLNSQRFEGQVSGEGVRGLVRGEGTAPRTRYEWRATRRVGPGA